ncbi:MAG TPA: basic secretory protein-like protein [Gemmataceae bacterium]|nr:basic secretory protein-like protein [Gemmataceae bacterium]
MPISTRLCLFALVNWLPATAADPAAKKATQAIATVESSLKTAGGNIRQFALDGDADTFFASDKNPGKDDHFTLTFDRPVDIKKIDLWTGRPNGDDFLGSGVLEVSTDGKSFKEYAKLSWRATRAGVQTLVFAQDQLPQKVQAVRIKTGELDHPLVIREIKIESDPPVAVCKYPVEIALDVTDAPEMKDWGEKVVRICEGAYPMINDELNSDGFKPATLITMTLKKDYRGVAATGGTRITGSAKFFQDHPDDVGAMVHETVHVVQQYRTRNNPGWLVEGIADYVRFFKFEPGKIGRINADRAKYDGSYRVTAAFLNYATEKYDKDLVKKLNKAMRDGEYKEDLWKEFTKKTVQELDEEWRASLKK